MKNITNILRVATVACLIYSLYLLYSSNSKLQQQVKSQAKEIDSLKHVLYETQF